MPCRNERRLTTFRHWAEVSALADSPDSVLDATAEVSFCFFMFFPYVSLERFFMVVSARDSSVADESPKVVREE
jgi:hypothetical protein